MTHNIRHGLQVTAAILLIAGYGSHSEVLIAAGYAMQAIEAVIALAGLAG